MLGTVQFNPGILGTANTSSASVSRKSEQKNGSFDSLLQTQINKSGVQFSAHAQKRLAERNVKLSDSEQARLGAAVDKAQQKGADKSLVLMDDLALVVSARNRTVITAVDASNSKDGVFTNIDSAVIA